MVAQQQIGPTWTVDQYRTALCLQQALQLAEIRGLSARHAPCAAPLCCQVESVGDPCARSHGPEGIAVPEPVRSRDALERDFLVRLVFGDLKDRRGPLT